MERSVARLRAVVIGVNIICYFLFIGVHGPRAPLALTIVVGASAYAIWSLVTRPYERYPLLRFGFATLTMDAVLISLWVLGTGGAHSEFWVVYIVSVISVAMRYDVAQTTIAAVAEAALYLTTMLADGGLTHVGLAVRPAYIIIAGYAAGLLARQERISRRERVVFQRLADEHSAMLERERATIEELRRIDRVKSDFVANASHELRTPITSLVGYASTIALRHGDMTDRDLEESVGAIKRQSLRLDALIRNLLDLSQIEYGKTNMIFQPVDIGVAVRHVLEVAAPGDDDEIDLSIAPDAAVVADPLRLDQILTNLLVNAFRYGGPHVSVAAERQGELSVISVNDDGAGVPAELVPLLFSPFARGRNAAGSVGSGLGLAISYRLAEAMGGSLTYGSKETQGARFVLRLPAAEQRTATTIPDRASA